MTSPFAPGGVSGKRLSLAKLLAGFAAGVLVPLSMSELCIRLIPPADLQPYLGDDWPQPGIYKPDPILRVDYRDVQSYRPAEAPKLADLKPLNTQEPTWIFFGNSFARGLSASVRRRLSTHRVLFFRESKDEFHLRVAQFRLILENGLKPERAFFTLIPAEISRYVTRPLSWVDVNRHGSLCSSYNRPWEPLNAILDRSWTARLAWVRSKFGSATLNLRPSQVTEAMPEQTVEDFRVLFHALGEISRKHQLPVTLVILPERRQILGKSSFAMQETLTKLAREAGLDAFDPREAFLGYPDKRSMYLPDWHYSLVGDDILLDALQAHLQKLNRIEPGRPVSQ
jgi:hypothetical protein